MGTVAAIAEPSIGSRATSREPCTPTPATPPTAHCRRHGCAGPQAHHQEACREQDGDRQSSCRRASGRGSRGPKAKKHTQPGTAGSSLVLIDSETWGVLGHCAALL